MLVHSDYIDMTSKQMFKEALETHQKKCMRFHLYTDIHIASFMLFISRNRAKETQCTDSKHTF